MIARYTGGSRLLELRGLLVSKGHPFADCLFTAIPWYICLMRTIMRWHDAAVLTYDVPGTWYTCTYELASENCERRVGCGMIVIRDARCFASHVVSSQATTRITQNT